MEASKTRYAVDGHVHFYSCFDERTFFDTVCRRLELERNDLPTLLLTETSRNSAFSRWKSGDCIWPVETLKNDSELLVDKRVLVIAGRQIITAEGIEVLATFVNAEFPDAESLETTIKRIDEEGGLPILPWGVGKWIGKRGPTIAKIAKTHQLLLGDIAGRPNCWGLPQWTGSLTVIPGSDPLPYPSQEHTVGSLGFRIEPEQNIDLENPSLQLRKAMTSPSETPIPIGKHVSLTKCVVTQLRLRFYKRYGRYN